jgi:tRNA threonylcarbamoyl adenosine modification protein (Sua5/YciO/YrdC/YwlC family)
MKVVEEKENQRDLLKYQELIKDPNVLSRLYEPTEENIKECAEYIKNGGIVGMPTETVYGLAANAFNVEACYKIFEYKGRPLTDPLIVHVSSIEMAKKIIIINKEIEPLFNLLIKNFWPGPLTIVLKANMNLLSSKILAGHDTVGIRFPINPIANKLIKYSDVPIAAPSANKFSHISPVNPFHVFEDFKEFPVKILNGGVSQFCMESTVMKICYEEKKLLIFRLGAVSPDDLRKVLDIDEQFKNYKIECLAKKAKISNEELRKIKEQKSEDNSLTINQDAPGQFLKHYSPKLETYLYSGDDVKDYLDEIELSDKIVFIDYKEIMKNKFLGKKGIKEKNFLELSKDGNADTVMQNFYNYLHEAEKIEGMKYIIIIDLEKYMDENSHKLTLLDRMWKAASFKKVKLIL